MFHVKARNFLDFLLPVVGISFGVSLVVGTVASLFFPKNVAGPLYRIEEDVRKMAGGDLTVRIRLRDGDEGAAVAGQINQLADLFEQTVIDGRKILHKAGEINGAGAETTRDERQEELQALYEMMDRKIKTLRVTADKRPA